MIFHATPTRTTLGETWAIVIDRLCAVLAHHAARLPALAALLSLVHYRFLRTLRRLDRLAQRWQANTLPKPRARKPRAERPRDPSREPGLRLPRGRIWLIRLVQQTAPFGGQIATLLAQPEIRALVQAAPQAGRLLRPLCRALGVPQPDWLRLRARPRKPRPPRARPRPATPKPAPFRPLPAYVRAAVRAWKPKYG